MRNKRIKRKKAKRRYKKADDALKALVAHVLRGTDDNNVVIGPLLERPDQPHP
jgi:ribosomal protein L31E